MTITTLFFGLSIKFRKSI